MLWNTQIFNLTWSCFLQSVTDIIYLEFIYLEDFIFIYLEFIYLDFIYLEDKEWRIFSASTSILRRRQFGFRRRRQLFKSQTVVTGNLLNYSNYHQIIIYNLIYNVFKVFKFVTGNLLQWILFKSQTVVVTGNLLEWIFLQKLTKSLLSARKEEKRKNPKQKYDSLKEQCK